MLLLGESPIYSSPLLPTWLGQRSCCHREQTTGTKASGEWDRQCRALSQALGVEGQCCFWGNFYPSFSVPFSEAGVAGAIREQTGGTKNSKEWGKQHKVLRHALQGVAFLCV